MFDRETEGLIRLAKAEERAIIDGRLKPEDATALPLGTHLKNGKVVLPPTGIGTGFALLGAGAVSFGGFALVALAIALVVNTVRAVMVFEVHGVPVYLGLAFATGSLVLGAALFWARDVQRWRSVAVLQIGVALAGGMVAYFGSRDPVGEWIVLAAAAVTVANGFDKLWKSGLR